MSTDATYTIRFVVGLGLLAVGPIVVFPFVAGEGVDRVSVPARHELGMLGLAVAATAVAGFARLQPVAVPWRPARVKPVLATYLPFFVAWVGFVAAYLFAARAAGHPVAPQAFLDYLTAADLARPGFWLVVVGITIAAPVAEEIVFRGYLQGALDTRLPRPATIAIVGAVFGLVHTLPYALPIGVVGAMFSWLVFRHGSLLPAVVAHAAHNSLIVVVTVAWPGSVDLLY